MYININTHTHTQHFFSDSMQQYSIVSHLSKVMHKTLQILSSVKFNFMSYLYFNNIIKIWNSLFLHMLAQVTESAYMLSHVHPSTCLHVINSPTMGQIWVQFHIRLVWKPFTKVQISLKSYKNIRHYSKIMYVDIVNRPTKQYVTWQCEGCPLLHFHGNTSQSHTADSDMRSSVTETNNVQGYRKRWTGFETAIT